MKAYQITNPITKRHTVIFAELSAAARREGAKRLANGDFMAVTCKRAPWADPFHGRRIPANLIHANDPFPSILKTILNWFLK